MKRVWQGILGLAISLAWASGCIAVYDWDVQGGNGGMGAGGDAGTGGVGPGGNGGTGGNGGNGGTSVSSSSSSSSGNPCPGCTWGRRFGGDQQQMLVSMDIDSDGSVYFTGYYDGELRLDANHAVQDDTPAGNQAFLAKLDRYGQPLWITKLTDFSGVTGGGGSVSVANGIVAWTGGIDGGSNGGDSFVEIRSVNSDANTTLLRRTYGTTINDDLRSSALSPDGKTLYLAGAVVGSSPSVAGCPNSASFDTGGQQNLMVFAIDTTTGNCLWGKVWKGGVHLSGAVSVATGSDGSPFVTGHITSGTITNSQGFSFPPVPTAQAPKYGSMGFIIKLNKQTGDFVAAKGYAHAGFLATTADNATNTIVVVGGAGTEVTFKGTTWPAATNMDDGADNLAMAFDENLNEKWISITGGPKNQAHFGVASNRNGRIYAASLTNDKIDRGAIVGCSTDRLCSVLMGWDANTGALLGNQTKTFGETQPYLNMGKSFVCAATPNALAVGGTWTVPVRFWDDILLDTTGALGDYDIAVGKVEPLP